ncbi:MAG TPA: hypothetical protein VKX16_03475 [Chloroflexota bacterium]|nr:hypothetical protein [Chloroflexota bacterium]
MAADEYHEALLARIQQLQREIVDLPSRDATSYAYLISQEIPEEAARMLVAEMLLDYRSRHRAPVVRPAGFRARS